MIDLTNYEHRRGVMILNSKDVRTVDSALFDWQVHTGCAQNYVDTLVKITERLNISDSEKQQMIAYFGFVKDWIDTSFKDIEKAREVFR